MIAAAHPVQRAPDARLLVVDAHGRTSDHARVHFPDLLRRHDLVVANDAATMPASLSGVHVQTGSPIELRLAARRSLAPERVARFTGVVFGAGDFRTPTERRALPPTLRAGDELRFGPLRAVIRRVLGHPRLVDVRFCGTPDAFWEALSRHGRPIQYAYVQEPLAIWDTWTRIASLPVAFEAPSASFILDWVLLRRLRVRGVAFGTITLAAGISSTGDEQLDRLLPFDEPYHIPASTARAIEAAHARGRRVIAVGTTVVRALEHAASRVGLVRPGAGRATQRIGAHTGLRVVDAIVSGTHERGTSHYELLRAFQDDAALARMDEQAEAHGYRTHEFGDSVFVERQRRPVINAAVDAVSSRPTGCRIPAVA